MIVNCESCQASFTLDDRLVKPTGSKVRCSKCAHVFKVFPLETAAAVEPSLTGIVENAAETVSAQPPHEPVKEVDAKVGEAPSLDDDRPVEIPETGAEEKLTVSAELDQFFQEISAEKEEPTDPSLYLKEAGFHTETLNLEKDAATDNIPMADVDRFLSMDAALDFDKAELSTKTGLETIGEAAPSEENKTSAGPSTNLSAPIEFEDLDLTLEPDEIAEGAAEDDLQLEMDLDLKGESETEVSTEFRRSEEKNGEIELSDLDLSELDLFFEGKGPTVTKEPSLETSLAGLELPGEKASGGEGDMVFDLADLELELENKGIGQTSESAAHEKGGKADTGSTLGLKESDEGGIDLDELERMISESSDETGPATAAATAAAALAAGVGATQVGAKAAPTESVETATSKETVPRKPAPVPKRRKSKLPLLLLLVLALLAAGAYVLNQMGVVHIPFMDVLKPSPPDPTGNLHIQTTGDPETKFIENKTEGRLFVISGKVTNQYPKARGKIRVKANIIATGAAVAQTRTVSCGNLLADVELATLDFDTIVKRLENPEGENKANVKVEPGKSIPFMIVFSKLPEKLEEFEIEVVGSSPAS